MATSKKTADKADDAGDQLAADQSVPAPAAVERVDTPVVTEPEVVAETYVPEAPPRWDKPTRTLRRNAEPAAEGK